VARTRSLLRAILNVWRDKTELAWGTLTRAAQTFCERLRLTGATSPQAGAKGLAINDREPYELSLAWELMNKLYDSINIQYRSRKLDCRGIVVVANNDERTPARRSAGPDLGWNKFFAIDLQVITAESHHLALPQDYNRELELKLVAALDRLN